MLRYSLLAGPFVAILAVAFAVQAKAADGANSVNLAVTVAATPEPVAPRPGTLAATPEPAAPTPDTLADDVEAPTVGESDTSKVKTVAAVLPTAGAGFSAGMAVASDDSAVGSAYADDVASSPGSGAALAAISGSNSVVLQSELCNGLCCNTCPCYYVDVEALVLKEEPHYRNQPLLVNNLNGNVLQTTSGLGYVDDPGVRVTFGIRTSCCRAIEFTYFSLFRNGTSSVYQNPDPANIVVTFPTGPQGNVFLNMNRVQTDYSTYLNSFELNFPCCCGCCCSPCGGNDSGCNTGCGEASCGEASCGAGNGKCARPACWCRSAEWYAGFRYIEVGNDLNIGVTSFPPPFTETGSYTVHAINRLFGGQIGGRLRGTYNHFGIELSGAAGIYGDDATQSQTVIDYPNFPLRNTSVQQNFAAFEGELNLSGIYRLNNVWDVKAGYSVIWLEGLALAPDQLDFNFATAPSGNTLSASGGMFLHGVNVGLEARW